MDESQQYGNYHEIAALAAIQQPALLVFVGDIGKRLEACPREGRSSKPTKASPPSPGTTGL